MRKLIASNLQRHKTNVCWIVWTWWVFFLFSIFFIHHNYFSNKLNWRKENDVEGYLQLDSNQCSGIWWRKCFNKLDFNVSMSPISYGPYDFQNYKIICDEKTQLKIILVDRLRHHGRILSDTICPFISQVSHFLNIVK